MRNQYPGPCYRCGQTVEPGAGHFERHPTSSGKWRTQRADTPPASLQCDAPGCQSEMVIRIGAEQRCYRHALERGNEIRAARGLPLITVDEEGGAHVVQ